ncbi:hypothetical protein C8R44DRAFT_741993 [Mycena epipterygia]|nr:hypothetical protein C8R44DRAFT_741993 [Mycena epipterygia]
MPPRGVEPLPPVIRFIDLLHNSSGTIALICEGGQNQTWTLMEKVKRGLSRTREENQIDAVQSDTRQDRIRGGVGIGQYAGTDVSIADNIDGRKKVRTGCQRVRCQHGLSPRTWAAETRGWSRDAEGAMGGALISVKHLKHRQKEEEEQGDYEGEGRQKIRGLESGLKKAGREGERSTETEICGGYLRRVNDELQMARMSMWMHEGSPVVGTESGLDSRRMRTAAQVVMSAAKCTSARHSGQIV